MKSFRDMSDDQFMASLGIKPGILRHPPAAALVRPDDIFEFAPEDPDGEKGETDVELP